MRWLLHAALTAVTSTMCLPGLASTADAQDTRAVQLELEDCLGADASAVRRIAAAELGAALLGGQSGHGGQPSEPGDSSEPAPEGDEDAPQDVTVIRADCGVESAVVVVEHASRGLRFEQRVDLTAPARNARTRLLALSIVELVAATWAALDALPPVVEAAPVPREAPAEALAEPAGPEMIRVLPSAPPPADPGPRREVGLRFVGTMRVSGTPVHVSGGGGVGVDVALPYSLGVGADLRYEQGSVGDGDLGDVVLHALWGNVLALVRPIVGWSSLTLSFGVKVGAAWLEGLPAAGVSGATHAGVILGPTFGASTALHLAGMGYAYLGLELSWLMLSVSGVNGATGEEIARFGGPQIGLVVGFEIQPGDR